MIGTLYLDADSWAFNVPGEWWHEDFVEPRSLAFVCTCCGDTWGRFTVEGRYYEAAMTLCPGCPSDGVYVPGSLLWWHPGSNFTFTEALPVEVWRREVEIHIRHREKE